MTSPSPPKAMILAAGLGERLRPLTLTTPKPLISIGEHPLIQYNLALLKKFGVREVMINLYHLGGQIKKELGEGKPGDIKIHYSEEENLLGTGGGLKKVADFFEGESFFMINADILIDLNLTHLFEFHQKQQALATLVVTPSTRIDIEQWIFTNEDKILGIDRKAPPKIKSQPRVFTGVQVLEPEVLKQLPPFPKKSCIIQDGYIPLLKAGKKLSAYPFQGYWRDLGTLERYQEVQKEFAEGWPYTTLSPVDLASL